MRKNKKLSSIIRIVVSITLLLFILSNINWNDFFRNIKEANLFFLSLTLLLYIFERLEITYKWNLLIKARGIDISFNRLFIINLIGSFWGLFIPSSLGTDLARGYYLAKNNEEKSVSISSVFVDRVFGLFSIILLALFSIFFTGDLISEFNIRIFVFIFSFILIVVLYLLQKEKTAVILEKFLSRFKYKKFTEVFIKLHKSVLVYKKYPKTLLFSFFITILAHLTRVFIFYFISLTFNIPVPLIYFFLFVPLITLIIMIPISIGGLGVGEGAFIAFFSLIGISLNDCIIMAFSNSILNTFFTLLGGVAILFYNSSSIKENAQLNKT